MRQSALDMVDTRSDLRFPRFTYRFESVDRVEPGTFARYSGFFTFNYPTQRFKERPKNVARPQALRPRTSRQRPPRNRPIHHTWWFWAAIVLMLGAMVTYVMTMNEAIGPGGKGQEMPAAAP